MAKKNTYHSRDGYNLNKLPQHLDLGNYNVSYVSTRNDDTEIHDIQRLPTSVDKMIDVLTEFRDTHSTAKLHFKRVFSENQVFVTGWRPTTEEERETIAKMKQRRLDAIAKRKAAEKAYQEKQLKKERERQAQIQERQFAELVKNEDRIVSEALKLLKKRGVKVNIIDKETK